MITFALKADPVLHLSDFAESNQITEKDIKSAESFLVNVLTSDPSIKTFDDLRLKKFTHKVSVMDLPPTSFSIVHGHVPRWWYITKLCTSLLASNCDLDPLEYGWYLDMSNILLPVKYLNPLPDEYTSFCSCRGGCCTRRCKCRKHGFVCTDYCSCLHRENKT